MCSEKIRLLAEYEEAAEVYRRHVNSLRLRGAVADEKEYRASLNYTDLARVNTDRSRSALEQHVAEHGC